MRFSVLPSFVIAAMLTATALGEAQEAHKHTIGMPEDSKKMAAKSPLKPAEGARVKIITPKEGQVFKGDVVPLEFNMKKGKMWRARSCLCRWRDDGHV